MRRSMRHGTALLASVFCVLSAASSSSGAEETTPRELYDQAVALESQEKYAEATELYAKVEDDVRDESLSLAAGRQRAALLAVLGKTDEAVQSYEKDARRQLAADGVPPESHPHTDVIHSQARWEVASVLLGSRQPGRYAKAKEQYELLLKECPNCPLAQEASQKIEWLNSVIVEEAGKDREQTAIRALIRAYETALRERKTSAAVSLLASPPTAEQVNQLERYLRSPQYKAYLYRIKQFCFAPGMSSASVVAEAVPAGESSPKPASKLFRVVNTAEGWRLERF